MSKKKLLKKDKAIELLQEGLSVEEIPNFSNINEIENIILESEMDVELKKQLKKKIFKIKNESVMHSKYLNELILYVLRSKKNEF